MTNEDIIAAFKSGFRAGLALRKSSGGLDAVEGESARLGLQARATKAAGIEGWRLLSAEATGYYAVVDAFSNRQDEAEQAAESYGFSREEAERFIADAM